MILKEFILKEVTNTHFIFTLKIQFTYFLFFKKIKYIDCFRQFDSVQSRFMNDGTCIYTKYLNFDNTINAILSKVNKNYKNEC